MTAPAPSDTPSPQPADIAARLAAWFPGAARDLPWRAETPDGQRDPYAVLVSELMLQQTQVSRVVEKFDQFIARFPTAAALAAADEQDVLAAWSGLGYYRRARHLHAAAKAVLEHHQGRLPPDPAALRALPGVGPYTAGAIASLAFNLPEPIVDGNVTRVLMRLYAKPGHAAERAVQHWAWAEAANLATSAAQSGAGPAVVNEAVMELGATVCTPKAPNCNACPLAAICRARKHGRQDTIPQPKPRSRQRELFASSVLVENDQGHLLVERRPDTGLWAGLWQAPTIERDDRHTATAELKAQLGISKPRRAADFTHQTTHRLVRFRVYTATATTPARGEFRPRDAIAALALSNPQRRILLADPADTLFA